LNCIIKVIALLGRCSDSDCTNNGSDARPLPQARSLEPKADALLQAEDGALMASYSVFVLEPGEQIGKWCVPKGLKATIGIEQFRSSGDGRYATNAHYNRASFADAGGASHIVIVVVG
jgi:hypothetical protein